ncbi:PEPxxWA-CTERM sorting domain-containing protein [Phenylobacterium sp.]|uniref:PEPxxWA-CTERM sorting domain-containing protein n=1 Tax=Phenylobacterium sp. TaxID=1871053 RepID=UPI002C4D133E|nr:PEPxxWA-CTERM sorting domain-containing protein [Phenylobacterium sp.]HLZ77161.1 PEPxxWA-CTERM sorting domain-containing protein [Phenylobacterium sp.]
MKTYFGALAALAVVASGAPALADTLFNSGAAIPGSGGPDLAEFNAADQFTLVKASTITGGTFDFSDSSGTLPANLTYTFYANGGVAPHGPPGTALATGALIIDDSFYIGDPGQTPHYKAIFTLASAFVADAATQYFFGIHSPSFADDVSWVESNFRPAVGFYEASKFDDPSEPTHWRSEDQTLAFSLTGAALPEPASWSLMIIGFSSLGAMLRRSRRRPATG